MHDDFEVELRIDQLGKAYAIASTAVRRARLALDSIRADPTATAMQVTLAERRCDVLVRRRTALQRNLAELEETEGVPLTRNRALISR